jgi:DNA-binding winged helix-turn-helix (wHTH) protein/tetratricopeptide (TPR) repeat protein
MSLSKGLKTNRILTFGPFRLRLGERVLEKDGQPISIPEKTLAVLCVLMECPGELVEKDTLKQRIWPDTFVEDTNIAFQVSTLRRILEESATDPRFITTVPKRGYRFVHNVTEEAGPSTTQIDSGQMDLEKPSAADDKTTPSVQTDGSVRKSWIHKAWTAGGLLGVLTLAGVFASIGLHSRSLAALAEKGSIVLADFENRTQDPVFDDTLRQGLLVELEQSPNLSLLPEQDVYRNLRLMKLPSSTRLTHEIAMNICQRAGSALMIEGYVDRIGAGYVLGLRAFSGSDGRLVAAEQAKVDRREEVLDGLSKIAARLRAGLGENAATLSSKNVALAEATTGSLEALKAYSTGWHLQMTRGSAEALPLLLHAIDLDPQFAMAYASLGRLYADLDESDLSAQNLEKAWALKEHTSERERFFITANYLSLVTGNVEQSRQVAEAWVRTYPRDAIPRTLLSGVINKIPGRYEEAATQARAAIRLNPDFGVAYYNLAVNNLYMQRLDEAERVLAEAEARGLDIDEFQMLEYDLAFLSNDLAAINRVAAKIRRHARPQSWFAIREAFRQAYSGHLAESQKISRQALAEAQASGEQERAGVWAAGVAVREALMDSPSLARRSAIQALQLSKSREIQYGAALALAIIGDSVKAQAIAGDLRSKFPEDTSVRFNYIPVIEAQIRLNQHAPDKAMEELTQAAITEMGVSRSPINTLFGALYPIYFRGLALQALKRGNEAASEFQKIIDHSGIAAMDPVGALAHLQLARSYKLAGDIQKAKGAYEEFFRVWRDADTNAPLLHLAQSEFRELQR